METLWSDLRHSMRSLLRDRGFGAVAILTLPRATAQGRDAAIRSALGARVQIISFPGTRPKRIHRGSSPAE
jgi:hypothetical protein